MKKTIFILMILAVLISMMGSTTTVLANTEMYQLQWAHEDATGRRYLDVIYTNTDQTALAGLDKYSDAYVSKLAIRVCGNGGNVYDVTNKCLVTKKCKGKEWFGIGYTKEKHTFHIIWIDDNDIAKMKYINDSQIYVLGAYRGEPLNALQSANTVNTNTAGMTIPSEQTVVQNPIPSTTIKTSGDFIYHYDGETYKYTLKKGVLSFTSGTATTEISRDVDVVTVAFVDKYVLYFTDDNEMYALELGKRSSGTLILEDVENIYYKDGSNVISSVIDDGENISDEDLRSQIRKELKNK